MSSDPLNLTILYDMSTSFITGAGRYMLAAIKTGLFGGGFVQYCETNAVQLKLWSPCHHLPRNTPRRVASATETRKSSGSEYRDNFGCACVSDVSEHFESAINASQSSVCGTWLNLALLLKRCLNMVPECGRRRLLGKAQRAKAMCWVVRSVPHKCARHFWRLTPPRGFQKWGPCSRKPGNRNV